MKSSLSEKTLGPWVPEDDTDKIWVRRDTVGALGQVRARVTFYDKIGAVVDFFCDVQRMRIPHGGSISNQCMFADARLREAGWTLLP